MVTWFNAAKTFVSKEGPDYGQVIGLNTNVPVGSGQYRICGADMGAAPPPDVWQDVDVSALNLPPNAIAMLVSGIIIITAGTYSTDPDIGVAFRMLGDSLDPSNYVMQGIAPFSGERTNGQAIIPIGIGASGNPTISWAWVRGDPAPKQIPPYTGYCASEWPAAALTGAWPNYASYGINLTAQAIFCSA